MIVAEYSNSKFVRTQPVQDFATPAQVGRLDALDGADCRPSMYFVNPRHIAEYCTAWLEAQAEPTSDMLADVEWITYNAYGDVVR